MGQLTSKSQTIADFRAQVRRAPIGELTHQLAVLSIDFQARAFERKRVRKQDSLKLAILTDAINRRTLSKFQAPS